MSFLDLASSRCSIRSYRPDAVEDDKLMAVLEAGRLAPSACNLQPWRLVIVRERSQRQRLRAAYDKSWFYEEAPVVIAVCCDTRADWVRKKDGKHLGDIDCAIAVDHMTLCAQELGLGTCWICAFDPAAVREVLGLPKRVEPVVLLPLGYPAEKGCEKRRRSMAELIHHERWTER